MTDVSLWIKFLIPLLTLISGCPSLVGCALLDQHAREFDTMRGMATAAVDRLENGAVGQYQVSGQALNPGIVVEAAIVYRASAKYDGLAGQFGASAQGQLGDEKNPGLAAGQFTATEREGLVSRITQAVIDALAKAQTDPNTP